MNTDKILHGEFVMQDGTKIPLHTPIMSEMWPAFTQNKPLLEVLIPAVTKKPWSWFLGLSLLDGANLIKLLVPFMVQVSKITSSFEEMATTKPTQH